MKDKVYHNTDRARRGHQQEEDAFKHVSKKYTQAEHLQTKEYQIHYGDFFCEELCYIEFKGEKKIYARDDSSDLDVLLIEFINNWSYRGWLYKQFTNFFMFKVGKRYLFVAKKPLVDFCEKRCKNMDDPIQIRYGDGKVKENYTCYQRWDSQRSDWRKDSTAFIKVSDLTEELEEYKDFWWEDVLKLYEDPLPLL